MTALPKKWREPGFFVSVDNSAANSGSTSYRTLMLGQKITAGTATAEKIYGPITSVAQAATLFGTGSQLHRMIRAFKAGNETSQIYAMALDDAAQSAAATGSLALTGPASENGTLDVYIGASLEFGHYPIGVLSSDSATTVGAAVAAAVNADTSSPVSAVATTGTIAFTAKNKGTIGNGIDIRLNYRGGDGGEKTPAGITATITAMSGGATDPNLTNAFSALGSSPFASIITPFTDSTNLTLCKSLIADRWGVLEELYGHVWTASSGSVATLSSFGQGPNDPGLTCFGVDGCPTPADERAAASAAPCIASLEDDPAVPLHTLPVPYILAPLEASRFDNTENNVLLYDGISPYTYASNGTVKIGRVITTYRKNGDGVDDDSYLDVTTRYTLPAINDFMKAWVLTKYPRVKLVANGTPIPEKHPAVTPSIIAGELLSAYKVLIGNVICQGLDFFKSKLDVSISKTDPKRLVCVVSPVLAGQLIVTEFTNKFYLRFDAA